MEARERGKRGFMAERRRKRRGGEKRPVQAPLPSPFFASSSSPLHVRNVRVFPFFGLQKPPTFSDRFETQPPIAEDGQKNWQVQLLFDQIEQPSFSAARSNGARKALRK